MQIKELGCTGHLIVANSCRWCGCMEVKSWDALECKQYATAGQAQKGHESFIRKYAEQRE